MDDIVERITRWLETSYKPDPPNDALLMIDVRREIDRLRAIGDALVTAIRNHDLREEHMKAWEEARRD